MPAKRRLEIANISDNPVLRSHGAYLIVIDEDHNGGVGGHFLDSIKISDGIDRNQGAVSSLTGTLPSGPDSLTTTCQLTEPLFPPCSHEVVFFVIFGELRTGTLALLSREIDLLVVHHIAGEGIDCLSETSFLGSLEGASISYDSFWPSVGVELGGGREIGSCGRHFGRGVGGQGLLVFVARIEGGAVVI